MKKSLSKAVKAGAASAALALTISMAGLTNDEILAKGATDHRWLIETCFSLVSKDSVKVPFLFNRSQDHYWGRISPRDLIVKARKQGFSTIRLARMVAKCMTMKNRHCVVVSHEEKSTMRLLERAVYMIENSLVKINCKITGNMIYFPDTNSKIWIGTAGAKAFGRGDDITDYHLSEYAFWTNPNLITGIEEGCMNGSEGCVESTANGWGTPYHKMWRRAEANEAEDPISGNDVVGPRYYRPHFYGWFWDDNSKTPCARPLEELDENEKWLRKEFRLTDAQILWRRLKIKSMADPTKFEQEYPATPEEAFLVAGMMVFSPQAIRKQEENARPVLWRGEIRDKGGKAALEPTKDGRLLIWIAPKRGNTYLATADVSSGIEPGPDDDIDETGCYSVWDIFDVATWEQVAQWRGLVPPDELGEIGAMLGMLYNEAMLAPEVNNHGLTTCVTIRNLGYRKLMLREDNKGGSDMGFYTMPGITGTRARLINSTRAALRDFSVKVNSPATFSELRSFVKKQNGKMGPQIGTFSDTVISLGIGILLLEEQTALPERNTEGGRSKLSMMNKGHQVRVTYPYKGGYS